MPILAKILPLAVCLQPACGAPFSGQEPPASAAEPVVAFASRSSHPLVLAGEPQEVFVYLSLRAAERPDLRRPAMNLALVIDRSGSMGSEDKLVHAKAAAEQLVGRLHPDDRLAIVAYDDEVRTVVPSTPAVESAAFLGAIRALVPGKQTDLCAGLVRGAEEVQAHLDPARQNAVLLLSDGLANSGVVMRSEIVARAEAFRQQGLRVSAMGMGVDYDEELLCGIAQHAAGNYYYVNEAESVGAFLDHEIDEMGRVVAREVEARIELADGVELRQVYGYPYRLEGRTVVVAQRDLFAGEGRKLVLRLGVRGQAGEERPLATSTLGYVGVETGNGALAGTPELRIAFTDSIEAVRAARDVEVLAKAEVVQNAEALDAAMKLQKRGQFEAAQELLAARYLNSRTVNESEYKSAEVERILQRIQQVMRDIERTRADARERRELQLSTQLRGLGYLGDD